MKKNYYENGYVPFREKTGYILHVMIGILLIGAGAINYYATKSVINLGMCLMGIIMIVRGGSRAWYLQKKENEKKHAAQSGRSIYATITGVEESWDMDRRYVMGRVVKCEYIDEMSNMKYFFTSEILVNVSSYAFTIGDPIRVYVEGNDYSKYYVDVENHAPRKIVDCT